ncbi:hypothetical protein QAD02_023581 [Eretmocerus hayati]|uniref:Uncharacterized protein n=1 Tax=Eretmocerus hayati TaxID=131215 RepID=A0ACC2PWE6_9HYME|nr:hypothetical protein QAD02_023581 [Eretmocerus hayati]
MSATLNRRLLRAVDLRDHILVKNLLDQGAKVNEPRDLSGRTCLLLAIRNWCLLYERHSTLRASDAYASGILTPDIELVRILLDAGADLTTEDRHKNTCLHYAAELDDTGELTKILLDAGAKSIVNNKNEYNLSPLHVAVQQGDWLFDRKPVVKLLIEAGARVSMASFTGLTFLRLCQSNDELFRILLMAPGAETVINNPDTDGITPFQLAVRYSRIDLVKLMIDRGANVNFISPYTIGEGRPLHIAAHYALRNKINLLLEHGADPDALNNRNESAIAIAARNFMPCRHHKGIIKILLQHRRPNNDESIGCSALRAIVQNGNIEAFEFYLDLIKEGITKPINEPLLYSASINSRHPEMLEYMLDQGICKINEKDENGLTALHKLVEMYSAVPPGDHPEMMRKRRYFKSIKNLLQNIAIIDSKKYHIDPSIHALIKKNAEFHRFYLTCQIELVMLQMSPISGSISYHSIIAKDRVNMWIRNKSIMNILEVMNASPETLSQQLPIYHRSFILNVQNCKKRHELVENAVEGLKKIMGIDSDAFLLIYHKILYNLRNQDLSNLSKILL